MHTGGVRREDAPDVTGSGQQDVLMPPQRRNWKRCASHVYIAHFIEYQLHCERCVISNRSAVSGWQSSCHCSWLQRLKPPSWLCMSGVMLINLTVRCRIQKQQQAQRLASQLSSMDAPHSSEAVPNGDHMPMSAAALTERLGSGDRSGGSGRPAGLPKRVTPLPTSAVQQSLALPLGGGLGQVELYVCPVYRPPDFAISTSGILSNLLTSLIKYIIQGVTMLSRLASS